jgi:hypothetical protein
MYIALVNKLRSINVDTVVSMKRLSNDESRVTVTLQDMTLNKPLFRAIGGDLEEALANTLIQMVAERSNELKVISSLS